MKTLLQAISERWTRKNGEVDHKMVEFCMKHSRYLTFDNFYLDLLGKPSIDSTIYYADTDYITGGMAKDPGTSFQTFFNHNIRLNSPKHWIETIEKNEQEITIHNNYDNSDIIKGWTTKRFSETPRANGRIATDQEKEAILEGLKEELAKYEKRLKTYFKRYSNKINTSSYWAER